MLSLTANKSLNTSFSEFKRDKDVVDVLAIEAKGYGEGKLDGRIEGKLEGKFELANQARELYEQGIDPNEIIRMIINKGSKPNDDSSQ